MTPEFVEQAIWIATAVAVGIAVVFTLPLAWSHRKIAKRTGKNLVAATISIFLSLGVYVVAGTTMMLVIQALVNPMEPRDGQFTMAHVFVNPGVVPRLLPFIAIVLTWVIVLLRRKATAKTAA